MARGRRKRRARNGAPGWIQTLVGTAVLLALGFGVGLVAGGALEEPELVARHVAGETVEAPLPEELPEEAPEDPLASALARAQAAGTGTEERPLGAPADAPAPEEPAAAPAPVAAAPTPARPAPAPAPLRKGFSVQVGAFSDGGGARQLVERLRGLGFDAYVAQADLGGRAGARFKVRVGPFPTRDEASAAAGRLHSEQRLPTWVLAEEGA